MEASLLKEYLQPTDVIDSDHPAVLAFAQEAAGTAQESVQQAVRLYYAVRDGIWYDPYHPFYLAEHYRASYILEIGRGYCVCKAVLLCALGRAVGIPSRLGFANVRNHLATRQLIDYIGSNLFVFHGFTEFFLGGRWVKATPAFNRELCIKHRVPPLEFNGREDSIFQGYNLDSQKFMEYVEYLGTYADLPLETIRAGWEKAYGRERVAAWIARHEAANGKPIADFYTEDVWKEEE